MSELCLRTERVDSFFVWTMLVQTLSLSGPWGLGPLSVDSYVFELVAWTHLF